MFFVAKTASKKMAGQRASNKSTSMLKSYTLEINSLFRCTMRNLTLKWVMIILIAVKSHLVYAADACETPPLLVGSSSLKVWLWDVYDVELKTTDGAYQRGIYPLQLEVTYKRTFSKKDLLSETQKQWQRFDLDAQQEQRWLQELNVFWPDISKQDRLRFQICADQTSRFFYNDRAIGRIEDPMFGDYFSLIWLDLDGPFPDMTRELIAQN